MRKEFLIVIDTAIVYSIIYSQLWKSTGRINMSLKFLEYSKLRKKFNKYEIKRIKKIFNNAQEGEDVKPLYFYYSFLIFISGMFSVSLFFDSEVTSLYLPFFDLVSLETIASYLSIFIFVIYYYETYWRLKSQCFNGFGEFIVTKKNIYTLFFSFFVEEKKQLSTKIKETIDTIIIFFIAYNLMNYDHWFILIINLALLITYCINLIKVEENFKEIASKIFDESN